MVSQPVVIIPEKPTRWVRRRIALLACGASLAIALAGPAGAQVTPGGPVGPNQVFGGLVNNSTGSPNPAVIRMACFGPIRPGQTGHPFAGQTVAVFQPEVIVGNFGFTGPLAHEIEAFFGPPPPSPITLVPGNPVFTQYGVPQAIPTSTVLPCAGRGQVTFVPLPMSPPTSRPAVVPVAYVGQP